MSWDLRQNTAKWNSPNGSIEIELAPGASTPWMRIQDASKKVSLSLWINPCELHGKHSAQEVPFGEAYVRQRDLIAIYPEHAPCRFGYQIDVRMLRDIPSKAIGLEIWLSIQTSLLDSHPQLELRWSGARFQAVTENYWTSTTSQLGLPQFGLMVHPLDQSDCHMKQKDDSFAMNVFGRFMEKGVIRRMRFRLIATENEESEVYWRERFAEFSESPLPLTT